MSESDSFNRSEALGRAIEFHKTKSIDSSDTDVIKTAELFRAFLTGESTKAPVPDLFARQDVRPLFVRQDVRPLFVLPIVGDNFVYFQFADSSILYRANLAYGSQGGGVQRICSHRENTWRDVDPESTLGTREKLRYATGSYNRISPRTAADILKENLKDVRFE